MSLGMIRVSEKRQRGGHSKGRREEIEKGVK